MIYGTNFMHCICTGYCESWILSLYFPLLLTLGAMHMGQSIHIQTVHMYVVVHVAYTRKGKIYLELMH